MRVIRKALKASHSRGFDFTYAIRSSWNLSIVFADTFIPNFIRKFKVARGDLAALMILDPDKAPFENVAYSWVVPYITVVSAKQMAFSVSKEQHTQHETAFGTYKVTSCTIHPADPPELASDCGLATAIRSPISYGLCIKMNSKPRK